MKIWKRKVVCMVPFYQMQVVINCFDLQTSRILWQKRLNRKLFDLYLHFFMVPKEDSCIQFIGIKY